VEVEDILVMFIVLITVLVKMMMKASKSARENIPPTADLYSGS